MKFVSYSNANIVNRRKTSFDTFPRPVYSGRLRESVVQEFTEIVKQAFREFVNDKIAYRLQSAIDSETVNQTSADDELDDETAAADASDGIETTQDEIDGYYIVKSILRETIDPGRIAMRDVRSYCGILLDDNNRQPICRLRFNRSKKYLSLFHAEDEERVTIESVDDIYQYAVQLKQAVANYLEED